MAQGNTMADAATPDEPNSKRTLRGLISGGAEIAGGAIGGALGFFASGPAGAAALAAGGSLAGLALSHVGEEIANRYLGPREKVRIGGVLALSAAQIKKRIDNGEAVRDDGFFESKDGQRPKAEEVAESILSKAQREAEEKKLPYMANLLANVAFEKTVSGEMSHQIARIAESLSYRQLCLIFLFSGLVMAPLRSIDYRAENSFSLELLQVLYEAYDLHSKGLVNNGGEVAFGITDLKPSSMRVEGLGSHIFNLMGLGEIPVEDLEPLAAVLSAP
jgi:hypothetical protein